MLKNTKLIVGYSTVRVFSGLASQMSAHFVLVLFLLVHAHYFECMHNVFTSIIVLIPVWSFPSHVC